MKPNVASQKRYDFHNSHLRRDARHLGDAENFDDIVSVIDSISPNVYMLSRSCVDGVATLQLANWDVVRRIRIGSFSGDERKDLAGLLESRGIEYRRTRYLALNADYSETVKSKFQRVAVPLYDVYKWICGKIC